MLPISIEEHFRIERAKQRGRELAERLLEQLAKNLGIGNLARRRLMTQRREAKRDQRNRASRLLASGAIPGPAINLSD